MNAFLITIGDELLNGRTVDTNAAFLAAELDAAGVKTTEILTVSDSAEAIHGALDSAFGHRNRIDLVLMTGGLGPTRDDVTKTVLADYFGCKLVEHPEVRANLELLFSARGRGVPEGGLGVALVPDGCRVLVNQAGTAPGLWFEHGERVLVSMPGVPYEVRRMMSDQVLPALRERFQFPALVHRTIRTAGIGESLLAERIADLSNALPAHVKLASLPDIGTVKLRLSATGPDRESLAAELDALARGFANRLDRWVYGFGEVRLEEVVGRLLKERGATLATAESCTGGGIAARITSVAGSSAWFRGGVVAYHNAIKQSALGVESQTLHTKGAVSEATVREMLSGAQAAMSSDYVLATSGIAGPDGGSVEKPVGLVYVGVSGPKGVHVKEYRFPGNRPIITALSITMALHLLRRMLADQLDKDTGKR